MSLDSQVTILIPTSPIPRHPATDLIESCIDGIRHHFPVAHIILMVDGVRPSVEHRRAQYDEYKKNLCDLITSGKLGNTKMSVFATHAQQGIMTKNTIHHHVSTPLIMFVEHDAIFRKDPPIAWTAIFDLLLTNQANLVRFYGWQDVWHEHEYLMRGEFDHMGSRFVKTVQYSQWPLVSRTDYHQKNLDKYVKQGQQTMIESVMYGPVVAAPWEENKIVIYLDEALTFQHRDGRTDEATGRRDPGEW
jgi:hypothetical protein